MAATPPSQSNPAGDDRNLVAVNETTAVSFEDKLHLIWKKNRPLVLAGMVLVLLAIAGKEGWEYLQRQKADDVKAAYAAATTPEQLKTFIAANPDHVLAGIAHLRMADDAYKAGKGADAIASYDKAIAALKDGPLVARAKLGRALAKAQASNSAEATNDLKQIADDKNQFKAIRAEAAYHLTSMAVAAGNAADAQKYSEQLMKIDPQSPWTQRGMAARASMPAVAADKPVDAAQPAVTGTTDAPKTEAKKEDAAPAVKLNIPIKK
jgi:hypothetical protein